MTGGPVDIAVRLALRRDVERLTREHPDLTSDAAAKRCAEWLTEEPHDEHDERAEPVEGAEGSDERPASRGDRKA